MQWKVYPADLLSVALDKREIAAISGSEPFSYRLLETGKYQLIASNMTGDYANLSCCVLGVSGSLARDHKPAAAALTQAILEAHSYAAARAYCRKTLFDESTSMVPAKVRALHYALA